MSCIRDHVDYTYTNEKGENFHLNIFAKKHPDDFQNVTVPVLICIHGAGMSGDNFFNLATALMNSTGANEDIANKNNENSPSEVETAPRLNPIGRAGPMAPVPSFAAKKGPNSGLFAGNDGVSTIAANRNGDNERFDIIVVTFDLRCHGTSTYEGGEENLSLDVLVEDFRNVLKHCKDTLFPKCDFFIIGHSLGGSVMCSALFENKEAQKRVSGLIVLDIVEGTAKLSLSSMKNFLKKRPNTFPTVKDAETWFLVQGGMRSPEGAAVSVPPLLKTKMINDVQVYEWRTDLGKMEAVWDGWFDELDKKFISLPFSKMLCLANAERLDTQLTVAQMQGKFQFEIIGNECGHYIMDDATLTLAAKIRHFIHRINSVSQMLKAANQKASQMHYNNATIPPSRMNQ